MKLAWEGSDMSHRLVICLALILCLAACALPQGEAARLHDLFAREWEDRLRENPLIATAVGVHEYNDRLPSVTP